jgi:hypothetical protein
MTKTLIRMLLGTIKPLLTEWLEERALRLPDSERARLAQQLQVDVSVVESLEATIRERVLNAIRSWNP